MDMSDIVEARQHEIQHLLIVLAQLDKNSSIGQKLRNKHRLVVYSRYIF